MRHSEFQQWLRNLPTISLAPERDALARSKRVEKFEGDLDEHFANDRMAALLARLTYSREDERSGREPRHSITFSTDANIREGTAALAGAVRLYLRFRDDVSDSTDPSAASISSGLRCSRTERLSHWGWRRNTKLRHRAYKTRLSREIRQMRPHLGAGVPAFWL
jgi:hypothetical protein